MNEKLTRAEKAAATNRARKQQREERWRQQREDNEKAAAILRGIRDDEMSTNSERIKAIELLSKYTN